MTGGFVGMCRFISHPFKGSPAFCRNATCFFSTAPECLCVQVRVCACRGPRSVPDGFLNCSPYM